MRGGLDCDCGRDNAARTADKDDSPSPRSAREILADYERYKYELYKEKYINGNGLFGQAE